MHEPNSIRLLIISDWETAQQAQIIDTFARQLALRSTIFQISWKSNIKNALCLDQAFDLVIINTHGSSRGSSSFNLFFCIDEAVADAEKNRIRFEYVPDKNERFKNRPIVINLGCETAGMNLSDSFLSMGARFYIANPSSLLSMQQVVNFANVLLESLFHKALFTNHPEFDFQLSENLVKSSFEIANRIIDEDLRFGLFE